MKKLEQWEKCLLYDVRFRAGSNPNGASPHWVVNAHKDRLFLLELIDKLTKEKVKKCAK